jgi:hypothetical protein
MLTGARSHTHPMADRWFSSFISRQLRAIRGRTGAAPAARPRWHNSYARPSACSSRLPRQAKRTGRRAVAQGNLIRNPVLQHAAHSDPNRRGNSGRGRQRYARSTLRPPSSGDSPGRSPRPELNHQAHIAVGCIRPSLGAVHAAASSRRSCGPFRKAGNGFCIGVDTSHSHNRESAESGTSGGCTCRAVAAGIDPAERRVLQSACRKRKIDPKTPTSWTPAVPRTAARPPVTKLFFLPPLPRGTQPSNFPPAKIELRNALLSIVVFAL